MAHTFVVVLLFFVLLIAPCVVANTVDMDEEEAIADLLQEEGEATVVRVLVVE